MDDTGGSHRATRFGHVVALDGLRGVAVAAVVVYHLWPGALPGGFIGVDLFMVLSGFLLSSLLVDAVGATGRVAFGAFLLARFRRLLPALLLVLAAVSAYAAVALPPLEGGRIREHTVAALAYVANWRFVVDGTTYTDVVAGASPLRHLWSLGIEEQFYVALAIGVALLVRACRGDAVRLRWWLGGGAAALAAASAVWMATLHVGGADHARVYFGTDTRAQALLVGVVLGSVLVGRPPVGRLERPAGIAAAAGGVVLALVATTATESSGWMYLGGFGVVAVASATVVAGASCGPLRRVLELRPVVALGTISYGVYLWHWPIIVLADERRTGLSGPALAVAQLVATLVLALASYHAVERPVRRGALGALVGRPALLVGPMAVVGVLALAVVAARPDGPSLAVPPASSLDVPTTTEARPTDAGTAPTEAPSAGSPSAGSPPAGSPSAGSPSAGSPPAGSPSAANAITHRTLDASPTTADRPTTTASTEQAAAPAGPRRVVLLGDSVAHTLAGGVVGEFPDFVPWAPEQSPFDPAHVELISLARPACTLVPVPVAVPTHGDSYATVSFADRCGDWRGELQAHLDAGVHDVMVAMSIDLLDRVVDGERVELGTPEHDALLVGALDEVRADAARAGARLVAVALPPRVGHAADPDGSNERAHARLLEAYALDRPDVIVVDLGPVVCPDGRCHDWRYDGWHFTADGARRVVPVIAAQLSTGTR